jgi:hypothetical protein
MNNSSPVCLFGYLRLFMKLKCGILLAQLVFIGTTAASSNAEIAVNLSAFSDAIPIQPGVAKANEDNVAQRIQIALGDPVGLRLSLANLDDNETELLPVSLSPRAMPAIAVIMHPDGHLSLSAMDDMRARSGPAPYRRMEGNESIHLDSYIYTESEAETAGKAEYIFPDPGSYEIFIAYFTRLSMQTGGEGGSFSERVLDRINRQDDVLLSNSVEVQVLPAFVGWERLRDEGIVNAVRAASISDEMLQKLRSRGDSGLQTVVENAERPWLTGFIEMQSVVARNDPQKNGDR